MKQHVRTFLVWLLLIAGFVFCYRIGTDPALEEEDFETFEYDLENGNVGGVKVDNNELTVTQRLGGGTYRTYGVLTNETIARLSQQGVPIKNMAGIAAKISGWILPAAVIFLVLLLFFIRRANPNTSYLAMRRTKARVLAKERMLMFSDVGGCREAKEELQDVIDYLKDSKLYKNAGARVPRGILLEGPPGCGKTLLARAVAGETRAKFFLVSAPEFVEMFVGVGAARVRDTFEMAAKEKPAVIFIDELDAVGRRRGSGVGSAHDEREQTLNQLLICLDGMEYADGVVVLAATNRSDILDRALLRAGRFDRRILIPALTAEERLEVLKIHTRNKRLAPDLPFADIVQSTAGMWGAELENIANEAALGSIHRSRGRGNGAPVVTYDDFRKAIEKIKVREGTFTRADLVLIQSVSQLAESQCPVKARITLREGQEASGELIWADAAFLKILTPDKDELLIPKVQIVKMEVLAGGEAARPEEVVPDYWANAQPELG